jgi:hypothetical protein
MKPRISVVTLGVNDLSLSGSLGRRTVALLSLTIVVADAKTTSINYLWLWLAISEGSMKPGEKEKGRDLAARLEELQEDFPNFEITAREDRGSNL